MSFSWTYTPMFWTRYVICISF